MLANIFLLRFIVFFFLFYKIICTKRREKKIDCVFSVSILNAFFVFFLFLVFVVCFAQFAVQTVAYSVNKCACVRVQTLFKLRFSFYLCVLILTRVSKKKWECKKKVMKILWEWKQPKTLSPPSPISLKKWMICFCFVL